MLALNILGYVLLVGFFLIEHFVRQGKDTKNMDRTSFDKGSTTFISVVMGVAFVLLPLTPLLNWLGIGAVHAIGVGAAGVVLGACGLVVRYFALSTLGRFFSRTLREADDHALVTVGIYRFIRHPGYLSDLLIFIGVALAMNNLIPIVIIPITFLPAYAYRIHIEEKMLIEIFGVRYTDYQKASKRLIPFIL